MHIHITSPAAERLQSLSDSPDTVYKLVYDAEGCGCAVSGVPALWMLDRSAMLDTDLTAASEPTIVYEARHEVFYEDHLTLDYDTVSRSFRLSSRSQIYANDLPVVDRRLIMEAREQDGETTLRKLDEILAYNEHFVESKEYEQYLTNRYPNKKMVILTCMDTRLTELLPRALNLRNGDAKIIKNAGAIVIQPFGNVMRSILVALYKLNAEEVFVIGHHDCGMTGMNAELIVESAIERGIDAQLLTTLKHAGIDLRRWLRGFDNVHDGVMRSVEIIRNHPLLPPGTAVHGLLIHPETGKLDVIINGYEHLANTQQES